MFDHRKLLKRAMKKRRLHFSATQIIAMGFAGVILLGAGLLTLPGASRSGVSCGFFPALFTATSATCVTGLVLYDTYTQWSPFGQTVIITLIEIGGLGFMSAASTFVFLLRKRVGLRQKMVIAQALNLNDMDGVVRIQKLVLTGSLTIQGIGAAAVPQPVGNQYPALGGLAKFEAAPQVFFEGHIQIIGFEGV